MKQKKSNAGRPALSDDTKVLTLKISKAFLEKFPKPWAKHIRKAMEQYMEGGDEAVIDNL